MAQLDIDALEQSLLGSTIDVDSDERIATSDEDLMNGGSGMSFEDHFFEPQPGCTYKLKFIPNLGYSKKEQIMLRSLYRSIPDPTAKGKTFRYVSVHKVNGAKCPILEAFFELNTLKKGGNVVAGEKIKQFFNRSNQGCIKVQILNSPNKEEIGNVRLMIYQAGGENATIAQLLEQKLNPTKQQIADGFEREDIFDVFESSIMSLSCSEAEYGEGQKGRSFKGSAWLPKKGGAILVNEDGSTIEFKPDMKADGKIKEEHKEDLRKLIELISHADYDMHNYFAPKLPGDPRNTPETEDYITKVMDKVNEIAPILLTHTIKEIKNYGKASNGGESVDKKSTDIMADALPEELAGSTTVKQSEEAKPKAEVKQAASVEVSAEELDDELEGLDL